MQEIILHLILLIIMELLKLVLMKIQILILTLVSLNLIKITPQKRQRRFLQMFLPIQKENSTQEAESSADESVTPQETVAVKRNSSIPTDRASNAITKETVLKPMQVRKPESTSKAKEENKAEDTVYITNTPIERALSISQLR